MPSSPHDRRRSARDQRRRPARRPAPDPADPLLAPERIAGFERYLAHHVNTDL
jgi:hypothetical protein